jgi:hypothetical protein
VIANSVKKRKRIKINKDQDRDSTKKSIKKRNMIDLILILQIDLEIKRARNIDLVTDT